MMLSKKWILFCFIIATYILTASSQPTVTSIVDLKKRQDVTDNGAENSSVADYHHATLTRTSTTTATATATATNKGGKGGKGGNGGNGDTTPTSSGDKNPEPSVIPANTPSWYGTY